MLKRIHTFKGGYEFKNYAGQAAPAIVTPRVPSQVAIPLRQGFGSEVKPLVKKGESVSAGQIIGRDDDSVSSPVHSSINGIVEDVKRVNYFKRDVGMVVIRGSDGSAQVSPIPGHSRDWEKLANEEIEKLIYLSGASALDREGIPTRFKSSIISPDDVRHLIIHAVGSEPYNISLELLLEGRNLLNFFEGIKMLKRIMPNSKVHFAVNSRKKRIVEETAKLLSGFNWLDIYQLEPKYPQGYDEMLVPTILNQKFPYGYSAANIGVVILNTQAVLAVYDAVANGSPLIERTIALCGPSMKERIHVRARIGTALGDLLADRIKTDRPSRVVLNSLVTGPALKDFSLPIDKIFSQIAAIPENTHRKFLLFMRPGRHSDSYSRAFSASWIPGSVKLPDTCLHGEERPCISCGYCEEVCPVRIIPHLLSKMVKRGTIDETLMNYEIFHCIECGLCSFVCPVKIPLLQHMKEGHEKLSIQGCDRNQCILPYFDLKGLDEYRGVTKL